MALLKVGHACVALRKPVFNSLPRNLLKTFWVLSCATDTLCLWFRKRTLTHKSTYECEFLWCSSVIQIIPRYSNHIFILFIYTAVEMKNRAFLIIQEEFFLFTLLFCISESLRNLRIYKKQDAQNSSIKLYSPLKALHISDHISPSSGANFYKLYIVFGICQYVWLLCGYSHITARPIRIYKMRCTIYKNLLLMKD
jgi:hypothetical protein